MPTVRLVLSFSFIFLAVTHTVAVTPDECEWPRGKKAKGTYPCHIDADNSACCALNEVCLEGGLCYGSSGLPYRGACAGGWGNTDICPDACGQLEDDIDYQEDSGMRLRFRSSRQ